MQDLGLHRYQLGALIIHCLFCFLDGCLSRLDFERRSCIVGPSILQICITLLLIKLAQVPGCMGTHDSRPQILELLSS